MKATPNRNIVHIPNLNKKNLCLCVAGECPDVDTSELQGFGAPAREAYSNGTVLLRIGIIILTCLLLWLSSGVAARTSNNLISLQVSLPGGHTSGDNLQVVIPGGMSRREAGSYRTKLSAVKHTDYFLLHYDPSNPYLLHEIADIAHEELLRVSADIGYKPDKSWPFTVYVYAVHYDFIKAGGLQSSKFTVGTTGGEHAEISVDASGSFDQPRTIIAHELTHAIIFRLLGSNITALPLWFNEGLAKYESGGSDSTDHVMLADAASENSMLHLSELTESFPQKSTGLAYAESESAIEHLIKTHGKSAPRKILAKLATSGSFDKAVKTVTGQSADQFADEWFDGINKSYATVRLVKVVTAAISVFMAILAIAAFLVR